MENFVSQRQEEGLSTEWGLGEAKRSDLAFFSLTPSLAEHLPLSTSTGKLEPRHMQSAWLVSLDEWDYSSSSGAL